MKDNIPSVEIPKKILIMGLENSGKTSIVLVLEGKRNLLSFMKLSPTKGVNYTNIVNLGSNYTIWDFGGQEVYRKQHIQSLDTSISGANKLIYVIDVQDLENYDKSIRYFTEIVNIIRNKNLQSELAFSVFLHKFDPDLETNHPEITSELVSDLIDKVREVIPKDFRYDLFKTTIYTVFEKLIID